MRYYIVLNLRCFVTPIVEETFELSIKRKKFPSLYTNLTICGHHTKVTRIEQDMDYPMAYAFCDLKFGIREKYDEFIKQIQNKGWIKA